MLTRLSRLGTLPVAIAVLTGITALYYLLVAFGNITDYDTNHQFVEGVLGMQTIFDPEGPLSYRSIESGAVVTIAYIAIIVWETLIAIVLVAAFVLWLRALLSGRRRTVPAATRYGLARRMSTLGWTMAVLLFLGGFITIGGEWFAMWQSDIWNGTAAAFRNGVIAGIGLILANLLHGDEEAAAATSREAHAG